MRTQPGKGNHLEQEEDAWKQSWGAHIGPFLRSEDQNDFFFFLKSAALIHING